MAKTQVFLRIVKAQPGHPFAGLYAVERVYIKDNQVTQKEIVHEWDTRILSEAILARLGGSSAYEAYKADNDIKEDADPVVAPVTARTEADLKDLTQRKLNKELRGK